MGISAQLVVGCFTPELVERSKIGKTDGNRRTWYLGLGRYVTSGIKFSLCNFLDFRRHMWEDWCWQWCWSMPRNWPQLDGCTWLSGLEWNLHCSPAKQFDLIDWKFGFQVMCWESASVASSAYALWRCWIQSLEQIETQVHGWTAFLHRVSQWENI